MKQQNEILSTAQLEALKSELAKARQARSEAAQPAGEKIFSVYSR